MEPETRSDCLSASMGTNHSPQQKAVQSRLKVRSRCFDDGNAQNRDRASRHVAHGTVAMLTLLACSKTICITLVDAGIRVDSKARL